jgi:hypothetical protein
MTPARAGAYDAPVGEGRWGWLPLLSLVSAMGALVLSLAYTIARDRQSDGLILFWVGLALIFLPSAFRLVFGAPTRDERIGLIVMVGVTMYLVKVLKSPVGFTGYDELQHLRTIVDIVRGDRLFGENPLLTVSPLFPALETVAAFVSDLSGGDLWAAGIAVLLIVRVMMVVSLFMLYELVSSERVAGVAAVVYMANPSFISFSSQFAYESLALPLTCLVLLLIARNARRDQPKSRLVAIVTIACVLTVVFTHHVTSYFLAGLLLLWLTVHGILGRRDAFGSGIVAPAVIAVVGAAAWLTFVAGQTLGYLAPPLVAATTQFFALIAGEAEIRALFTASTGEVAPLWERAVGAGSVLLLIGASAIGIYLIWRRHRANSLAITMALLAIAFPASLAMRVTQAGGEAAGRASAFLFIGVSLAVALAVVNVLSLRSHGQRPLERRLARYASALVVGALVVVCAGGVVLGTSPATRLPGPYLVGADSRSIDRESVAAAEWSAETLGPDHRVAADRINRLLLGAIGGQFTVFHHSIGLEMWQPFLAPEVSPAVEARLRRGAVEYLLIDLRLSTALPVVPFYYEEGEIFEGRHTKPMSRAALTKWDGAPGASRIFDSGSIRIYDVDGRDNGP